MLKIKWPNVIINEPVTNWLDLGNGTMFRATIFSSGIMSNPARHGLFIGIEDRGCFTFLFSSWVSDEYVNEKLRLYNMADAANIADFINSQLGVFNQKDQQGRYDKHYIENLEPYGLIGEGCRMPIHPEIVSEV